jgi:tripartite-type tricarboxylate transporter receptor subunit TctC
MPRSDRERIQSVVTKALNFPEFAEKLRSIGAIPRPMPIDEFAAFMQSEQVRWKALVEQSGVKL